MCIKRNRNISFLSSIHIEINMSCSLAEFLDLISLFQQFSKGNSCNVKLNFHVKNIRFVIKFLNGEKRGKTLHKYKIYFAT